MMNKPRSNKSEGCKNNNEMKIGSGLVQEMTRQLNMPVENMPVEHSWRML